MKEEIPGAIHPSALSGDWKSNKRYKEVQHSNLCQDVEISCRTNGV